MCFAEFDSERDAVAARTDLYDLTWPPTSHSPGRLKISFTSRDVANKTVAEEPVGAVRDPVSARLGHIPGVAGLPGRDVGGIRGWGSLADATAARGGGARQMELGSRLGPIGGVAGFGIAGGVEALRSGRGGFERGGAGMGAGAGRGWGSLAGAASRGGGAIGGFGERMGGMEGVSPRNVANPYHSPRDAPVQICSLNQLPHF